MAPATTSAGGCAGCWFPFFLRPAVDGRGFETGHLWFVYLLLLYSLVVLPLFGWLASTGGRRAVQRMANATGRRGAVLLPAVLLASIAAGPGLDEGMAAGHELGFLLFFAAGGVLAADVRFRDALRRDAVLAAAAAVGLMVAAGAALLLGGDGDLLLDRTPLALVGRAAFGAAGWCAVVAVVGGLTRLGPRLPHTGGESPPGGRLIRYVAPAVLAWYVLHQPILVLVAYLVVGSPMHPVLEYLVICLCTAALTLLAYDVLVRRTALPRALFAGTCLPGHRHRPVGRGGRVAGRHPGRRQSDSSAAVGRWVRRPPSSSRRPWSNWAVRSGPYRWSMVAAMCG
ncbi:acyltransferase family protein [Blastococcus sp. VKM Ac-2987]|uniref:acyltransferase family protein n=1 Tax=Blastococcus sp. VKM Ac-2987 TaxID=3004141 RepID=UPI0022AB99A1|nr:acyltransferase family protein [Blastococcus sp. VKM Ac-2987]MCZ2860836.1 acyltransferase family protein [Blastococcus sp. VKM Ac-2987]